MIKTFENFENKTNWDGFENHNEGEENSIEEFFPDFYGSNKERVDSGRIKFFYDPYATECGVIIDLDSLETIIYDSRG